MNRDIYRSDHRAVHRAIETRNRAVAEALVRRPEHRLAQTLPRNQCPASRLHGLSIPVLDQFQTGARPWRPRQEGREIHSGHLLQDPRKAGRSREHGRARGRQASPHSVCPVGECLQSRSDRRHPGARDHDEPEHVHSLTKRRLPSSRMPSSVPSTTRDLPPSTRPRMT